MTKGLSRMRFVTKSAPIYVMGEWYFGEPFDIDFELAELFEGSFSEDGKTFFECFLHCL
jgi:hypothetical protein